MPSACPHLPHELRAPHEKHGVWADVLDSVILPARRNATWNNYYDDLATLLKWQLEASHAWTGLPHAPSLRVVEIGTMYGGASERMLTKLQTAELFVVDPFLGGFAGKTAEAMPHGGTTLPQSVYPQLRGWGLDPASLSKAWARAMAFDLRSRFGCRAHVFHNFSLAVAPFFADGSVDAAFIDGLHTYDALTADLHAWWPKIAPEGGVAILNDYGTHQHPDVAKAANAFFRKRNSTICVGARGRPPGHRNAWVVKGRQCQASRFARNGVTQR